MATNEAHLPIAVVLGHATGANLRSVDVLARLQLAAKRSGWSFRIHEVSDELRGLLAFVGLGDVLLVETVREPEERIQLGVEEVVQADDASA